MSQTPAERARAILWRSWAISCSAVASFELARQIFADRHAREHGGLNDYVREREARRMDRVYETLSMV